MIKIQDMGQTQWGDLSAPRLLTAIESARAMADGRVRALRRNVDAVAALAAGAAVSFDVAGARVDLQQRGTWIDDGIEILWCFRTHRSAVEGPADLSSTAPRAGAEEDQSLSLVRGAEEDQRLSSVRGATYVVSPIRSLSRRPTDERCYLIFRIYSLVNNVLIPSSEGEMRTSTRCAFRERTLRGRTKRAPPCVWPVGGCRAMMIEREELGEREGNLPAPNVLEIDAADGAGAENTF